MWNVRVRHDFKAEWESIFQMCAGRRLKAPTVDKQMEGTVRGIEEDHVGGCGDMKEFRDVRRSKPVDGVRSERQNPKIIAAADRNPVELLKDGGIRLVDGGLEMGR